MSAPIVIIGAGGFGREALDVIDAINAAGTGDWDFLGFVDDGQPDPDILARLGERHLGGRELFSSLPQHTQFVVAVADPAARRKLADAALAAGLHAGTLVHPTVAVGRDVEVGEGSTICAGVVMTTNIRVGEHCHINLNVTVGHDSRLGDRVAVNPLVAISGSVVIGDGVMLGTGAAVLQGLTVGEGAVVGAGAVVVKDVPPGETVVGIPAKVLG